MQAAWLLELGERTIHVLLAIIQMLKVHPKRKYNFTCYLHFVFSSDCVDRLAIYKAAYPFGGYMSDVIAAVDQVR
jgi:hypothetical protein